MSQPLTRKRNAWPVARPQAGHRWESSPDAVDCDVCVCDKAWYHFNPVMSASATYAVNAATVAPVSPWISGPGHPRRTARVLPEIRFAHLRAPGEIVRPTGRNHAPLRQDVAIRGNGEGLMHVLLYQKHRDAARVDLPDNVEILPNQDRREPKRRLVHQQELRRTHESAADGNHRLLAARHGTGDLPLALAQAREQPIDVIDALARHRFRGLLIGADA